MHLRVLYLLGGVLLEFGEVERDQVNGQHVVSNASDIFELLGVSVHVCSSAGSDVDGKSEDSVLVRNHPCCCRGLLFALTASVLISPPSLNH